MSPPLWRVTFRIDGEAPPEGLDELEDEALSLSLLAIEDPATTDPIAWQVELLFAEEPTLASLRAALPPAADPAAVEVAALPAREWLKLVAREHEPLQAGRFFIHGARERGQVPPGLVGIEIEAGLAFGSGEHATTRLCLEAIDALARRRRFRRVLDVGCGSGILAIAAARSWPARVIAVDNDPIAVRVAKENVALNAAPGRTLAVLAEGPAHGLVRRAGPYDLILANILADPLIGMAPALARRLAGRGHLILSGLLDRQAGAVTEAYEGQGLRFVRELGEGPWRALVLRRKRTDNRVNNQAITCRLVRPADPKELPKKV